MPSLNRYLPAASTTSSAPSTSASGSKPFVLGDLLAPQDVAPIWAAHQQECSGSASLPIMTASVLIFYGESIVVQ